MSQKINDERLKLFTTALVNQDYFFSNTWHRRIITLFDDGDVRLVHEWDYEMLSNDDVFFFYELRDSCGQEGFNPTGWSSIFFMKTF